MPPQRYRSASRWFAPNHYAGVCVHCELPVAAGTGECRRIGTTWIVRHPGGACHSALYRTYVAEESPAWQARRKARLEYAGYQCEWRSFLGARCTASPPLDCHHRHYRNLGHEPLGDLVALCAMHHAVADGRRRAWGKWPLLPRPFWSSILGGPPPPPPTGPGTPPRRRSPVSRGRLMRRGPLQALQVPHF